jgi:hypothetical protein
MSSAELKTPFAVAADGRMVTVDEVMRGLDCACTCVQCGAQLIATKGEIIRHHFRHHANVNPEQCIKPHETAMHRYAKQVICEHKRLGLPYAEFPVDLGPMLDAKAEISLGDIRPDVLCDFETEPVAVEILVAHRVPREKIDKYVARELPVVEIDLSRYRFVDRTDEEWNEIILYAAQRVWLVPPRSVREARERKRLYDIEQQKLREQQAKAEYDRLAAERAAREREHARRLAELAAEREALDAKYDDIYWRVKIGEIERRAHLRAAADERRVRALAEQQINDAKIAERRARERYEQEQQRREFEERRRVNAELREARVQRRRQELTPPSLQDLVAAFGGHHLIAPEAWEQFDKDREAWRSVMRQGVKYERW